MKKLKIDSICVKEDKVTNNSDPHVLAIHASSAFSYKSIEDSIDVFTGKSDGYVYTRYGNPTITAVEEKLANLETVGSDLNAFAVLTNSGMSAISTCLMSVLKPGEKILTQFSLYGGTTELMKSIVEPLGVEIMYTDLNNSDALNAVLNSNPDVKLIYFESPSNPTLSCVDIAAIVEVAHNHGTLTCIDNTFCTPYLQQPLVQGVDYIIYSTTKFLNGHGNSLGGAILTNSKDRRKAIWNTMKLMGSNSNAFDAWLLHNGLKTLAVRMDKHCANALALAKFLNKHDKVNHVNYPGLETHPEHNIAKSQMKAYGAVLSFELKGDIENAKKFMNACKLCTIASTLGNVDTLLLHPATSSHLNVDKDLRVQYGITDGLIRVSVGIENIEDIIEDINQAIEKAQ